MSNPAGAKPCRSPCSTNSQRCDVKLGCPLHPASAAKGVLGLVSSTSVPMMCKAVRNSRTSTLRIYARYLSWDESSFAQLHGRISHQSKGIAGCRGNLLSFFGSREAFLPSIRRILSGGGRHGALLGCIHPMLTRTRPPGVLADPMQNELHVQLSHHPP